jgi:hypothetical protein
LVLDVSSSAIVASENPVRRGATMPPSPCNVSE